MKSLAVRAQTRTPHTLFSCKLLKNNDLSMFGEVQGSARKSNQRECWLPPRDSQTLQTKGIQTFSTLFPTPFPTREIRIQIAICGPLCEQLAASFGGANQFYKDANSIHASKTK
jgi:hypothetical protein